MTSPASVSIVSEITRPVDLATAGVTIARRGDGAIVFPDINGNTVIAHSNPELTKLFEAAKNLEAPLTPELTLEGNNQAIVKGDITPGAINGTDFGSVIHTTGSKEVTYTITNDGDADLVLASTPVVVTGAGFSVSEAPSSTTIVPEGTATFKVTFAPNAADDFSALVGINSNDPDGAFVFAIAGTGIEDPGE
jgi:hypothetical protein